MGLTAAIPHDLINSASDLSRIFRGSAAPFPDLISLPPLLRILVQIRFSHPPVLFRQQIYLQLPSLTPGCCCSMPLSLCSTSQTQPCATAIRFGTSCAAALFLDLPPSVSCRPGSSTMQEPSTSMFLCLLSTTSIQQIDCRHHLSSKRCVLHEFRLWFCLAEY
ncbi:hypothetical protein PIB30_083542 [Stylosanthes scabra]|uniref:Uncharacterized protein n=1 Tax=Stylosanthes scabra TaxID=79078 RepID=A0ABU6RSH4_9FABA|nr:hypothetical protein [Stylosanthes scabra]